MKQIDPMMVHRLALTLREHTAPAVNGAPGQVVVFTSAVAGEGRSFVARMLADALAAQDSGSVALVDASFADRAPGASGASGGSGSEPGFAELMLSGQWGAQGAPQSVAGPANLGQGRANGAPLLFRADLVGRALMALRASFRWAVIDAPILTSAGALPGLADASVLVVDASRTPSAAVHTALEDAGLNANQFAGVVLNRREASRRSSFAIG